jgi:hypothetical protein
VIQGKVVTADALLNQSKIGGYLSCKRKAHYHITVKTTNPVFSKIFRYLLTIAKSPILSFAIRRSWPHRNPKIWTTTEFNDYLNFT